MHKNSVLAVSALVVAMSASAVADDKDKQDCANKDPDRAIRGCTAIIEHGNETPNIFATAFANRGVAYARKKDYDRAIADYTRAIEIDPRDAKTYNNRGLAYSIKGDYQRAISDLTAAVELHPKKAEPAANTAAPTRPAAAPAAAPAATLPVAKPMPQPGKESGSGEPRWASEILRHPDAN
jgi:tetratricopeptide (TPR) repeat protein